MTPIGLRAAAAGLLVAASVGSALPAEAVATFRAADGLRCTIVGTSGADHIVGTPGRDVICGLGGNDVINGGGGNDVIDGGSGNDSLSGSGGNDVIFGGSGSNTLSGGTGNDVLIDGTGTSADHASGGAGNDKIYGAGGRDVINGDAGDDSISSGAGNDTVSAGDGNDAVNGGSGNDVINGGAGNDDLVGGSGDDVINGGTGTNWCTPDPADSSDSACAYDLTPPVADSAAADPTSVDVSGASASVTVRVHVTDDTGVAQVVVFGASTLRLASGNARDGMWAATMPIPRYARPGVRDVETRLVDRTGRVGGGILTGVFSVSDADPDTTPPVVQSVSVPASLVVPGSEPVAFPVSAHITDDISGVDSASICFRPHNDSNGMLRCWVMTGPKPGTVNDGVWSTSMVLVPPVSSGVYDVSVQTADRAGSGAISPVVGTTTIMAHPDLAPPRLISASLTPNQVDSSTGETTVTADLHAYDPDGMGLTMVGGALVAPIGFGGPSVPASAERIGGTVDNEEWRLSFTVPQGTAPGTYVLRVAVSDYNHNVYFAAPDPATGACNPNDLFSTCMTPDQLIGTGALTITAH